MFSTHKKASLLGLLVLPCLSAAHSAKAEDTMLVTAAPPGSGAEAPAAEKQATLGNLGKRSVADVPYSVQTVSSSLIEQQQLRSVKDVYRYLPSVQGDGVRPQTRGMQGSVVQNSMIDGLNAVSTTEYAAEQFQQVEVLSGLGSAMYGPANPAGMFNLVSKRPTDAPLYRFTGGGSTGNGGLAAMDIGGPLDDGERVKYRLNMLNDEGHGYTHGSHKRRRLVDLGLDFQLTDSTVLETNFSHYRYYDRGLPASFALGKGVHFPGSLNPTKRKYAQSFAGNDDKTTTAIAHLKHDFDGNWLLDIGVLRQIADRESTTMTNTLTDNDGNYKTTTANSAASRFTINSYMANLTGSVDTGGLHHDLAMGVRGFVWQNFNPVNGGSYTVGEGSLGHRTRYNKPDFPNFKHRFHSAITTQHSFLLSDTLTFNPQWSLLLSGSENRFNVNNYANKKPNTTNKGLRASASRDSGASGSASLMYRPVDSLMLYTTYADSLQQGDTAPATAHNAGQVLNPYRSRQIEVGAKYAVNRDLLLTAALFRAKRPFAYVQDDGNFSEDGKQKNRGVELMVDGRVSDNLRLFGGVTWLDARLHNTADASASGKRGVGLPRYTANMLAVYSLPQVQGLDLDTNIHYAGKRYTDNGNDTSVGGYTTVDAGTGYRTTLPGTRTPVTWRFDVTNLTNRHYWTNIVPGALTGYTGTGAASAQLGAPRQAQVSMTIEF